MGDPVTHFEVVHKDGVKLQEFYSDVFGWKVNADNPMKYGMVDTAADRGIAGGIGVSPEGYEGHLTFYIECDDLEAKLQEIEKLGGKRVMDPDEVPGGPTIAQFLDPGGNLVGLTKGM